MTSATSPVSVAATVLAATAGSAANAEPVKAKLPKPAGIAGPLIFLERHDTAFISLASAEQNQFAVVFQAVCRNNAGGIRIVDDCIGQFAGFGEHASRADNVVLFFAAT